MIALWRIEEEVKPGNVQSVLELLIHTEKLPAVHAHYRGLWRHT